jgi:hypothetical protein
MKVISKSTIRKERHKTRIKDERLILEKIKNQHIV